MQLGLTIPLQRQLRLHSLPYGLPLDRFFCWDLHVILLRGRSSLLAVHCSSRYTAVLFDMTRAGWDNLAETAVDGIRQSLLSAGISTEDTARYFALSGGPSFTRTHGRREVAFLNRAWDDVAALDGVVNPNCQDQPFLEHAVNGLIRRCAGWEDSASAREFLQRDFERFRTGSSGTPPAL